MPVDCANNLYTPLKAGTRRNYVVLRRILDNCGILWYVEESPIIMQSTNSLITSMHEVTSRMTGHGWSSLVKLHGCVITLITELDVPVTYAAPLNVMK